MNPDNVTTEEYRLIIETNNVTGEIIHRYTPISSSITIPALHIINQTHHYQRPIHQELPIYQPLSPLFTSILNAITGESDFFTDPPTRTTLTEVEFSRYPSTTNDPEDGCSICAQEGESNFTLLPCNHVFHTNCIRIWLTGFNSSCPICRQSLR